VEIFPDAKVDDGILDVVILAPVGRLGWLGVLAGVFGRTNPKNTSVEYFAGKSAEIEFAHEQDFQLDGDPLGKAKHLKVTVEHEALSIRMTGA
jgi:diacylglycerol kinase family enzyme